MLAEESPFLNPAKLRKVFARFVHTVQSIILPENWPPITIDVQSGNIESASSNMSIVSICSVDLKVEMLSKRSSVLPLVLTAVVDLTRPITQIPQCHGYGVMAQQASQSNQRPLYN